MALRSGRYHNLKHHKDAADQRRAASIAKMGVLIAAAVHAGGGPRPEDNPRLRLAISRARAVQMTNEAIERAIKRASGEGADGKLMSELTYEGYAPGGVAVVVEALTDNRNRTAPEVKKLFERFGGAIGAPGCVAWQFKPRAVFIVRNATPDRVLEILLDGGADALDVQPDGDDVSIIAEIKDYDSILKVVTAAKLETVRSDLTKLPDNDVQVTDPAVTEQLQELLAALDEHADVQDVVHNAVFPNGM